MVTLIRWVWHVDLWSLPSPHLSLKTDWMLDKLPTAKDKGFSLLPPSSSVLLFRTGLALLLLTFFLLLRILCVYFYCSMCAFICIARLPDIQMYSCRGWRYSRNFFFAFFDSSSYFLLLLLGNCYICILWRFSILLHWKKINKQYILYFQWYIAIV